MAYVVKRQCNSFSFRSRGPSYRRVNDAPVFETRDAAQEWINSKFSATWRDRHIVDVLTAKKLRGDHHCQICERNIEANTGLIAHHGYQRPGHGWQTASCFGARYRPYEVSSDALPPAIESLKQYIANTRERLREITENPPAGHSISDYVREERKSRPIRSVLRPATWPERPTYSETAEEEYFERIDQFKDYERAHKYECVKLSECVKNATYDLKRLEKRLADWKPQTQEN